MKREAKRRIYVGRWLTIIVAVAYATTFLLVRITGELTTSSVDLRELIRDLIWALSWGWFLANAMRVLDTMKPSVSRIVALALFGGVAVWFSSMQLVGDLERGIRFAPQTLNLTLLLYGLAMGIIALLSMFRHDLIRNPSGIFGGATSWFSNLPDAPSVFMWLIQILTHPFRSIRRDPIRWSAIAGAVIWPTVSVFSFPALLVQAIAITCAIRYADTYMGSRIIRIAALALATVFVWFNFVVTVPFEPLPIAWLGPSLVLWTGSAVSAMFRPLRVTEEAVGSGDALLFRLDETSDLDSEAVREGKQNDRSRTE